MNNKHHGSEQTSARSSQKPAKFQRVATYLLSTIVIIAVLVFAACLFKHISYPLMWADESMTAVGAQRVLDYGYPKVHDGRNVFYDLRHNDPTLGIEKNTDAYIGGAGWFPYYFTAPFVLLSRLSPDLYLQTAIIRIPFALAGFAGLLLLLWTAVQPFEQRLQRLAAAALFIVLELPSVTLMLHLREARYYSLQLLFTAVALSVFAAYHLRFAIRYRVYAVSVIVLSPLLFLTFSPASLAFCMAVFFFAGGEWIVDTIKKRNDSTPSHLFAKFKVIFPVLASLVLVVPLAWFFKTRDISRQLDEFYGFSLTTYVEHVSVVLGYFLRYDVIAFAIAAKLLMAVWWRQLRNNPALLPAFRLSLLFSTYFILHTVVISKIPNELFTRYFITLQPILALTFAIDVVILVRLLCEMDYRQRVTRATVVGMLVAGSIGWAFAQNWQLIRGRLYEISHQYQGVLDFVIPYIREHHEHPDRLIIATNYEETSYIFYLDCRVIVGFLNPDFRSDQLEQPDLLLYRRFWSDTTFDNTFDALLKRGNYESVRFPVVDSGFNNIPETVHWTPGMGWRWNLHFFSTAYAVDPEKQTTLYIRRETASDVQSTREDGRGAPGPPRRR